MKSFQQASGYFKNHRGLLLFYQAWRVATPKAILIFVHGLGEHSGRYQNPVHFFTNHGYTCYGYDHQGHGRSEGQRTYAPSFRSLVKDLKLFIQFVAQHEKNKEIFVIGHSLGGQVVINYGATTAGREVRGLILSSPNCRVVDLPKIKEKIVKFLTWMAPRLPIPNELDPRDLSRDPLVVRAYLEDPLVVRTITVRLAAELLTNQEKMDTLAAQIGVPTLLLHAGSDKICDPKGTERCYERIATKDKKLVIYPGLYHEIFNEFERDQVFHEMLAWMGRH